MWTIEVVQDLAGDGRVLGPVSRKVKFLTLTCHAFCLQVARKKTFHEPKQVSCSVPSFFHGPEKQASARTRVRTLAPVHSHKCSQRDTPEDGKKAALVLEDETI